MNPGYAFTAQQNLVRNSTDQDKESIGPWLHPNRNENLLRVGFFSSLGTQKAKKFLGFKKFPLCQWEMLFCQPQNSIPHWQTPKATSQSLPAPCQQRPPTPITSRAPLLPLIPSPTAVCSEAGCYSGSLLILQAHRGPRRELGTRRQNYYYERQAVCRQKPCWKDNRPERAAKQGSILRSDSGLKNGIHRMVFKCPHGESLGSSGSGSQSVLLSDKIRARCQADTWVISDGVEIQVSRTE